MTINSGWLLDYDSIVGEVKGQNYDAQVRFLTEVLPNEWAWVYKETTKRQTDLCCFSIRNVEYIMDTYSLLVKKGLAPEDPDWENRVVAAWGLSLKSDKKRDRARQQYLLGPIEMYFGKAKDRGHFVAHSLGGDLDVNLFHQKRDINRGWSERGKVYRSMERYCLASPGTFFFSRPFYFDAKVYPSEIEFGILRHDRTLWVERFEN